MNTGIYAIENKHSSARYIGSARNLQSRWRQHKYLLIRGRHHSRYLQNSWAKHGEDAFTFVILEYCEVADLIAVEQRWIDATSPAYNICRIAGSRLGSKQRPEVRERIAALVRARQAAKTHCPKGHEYTPGNTYLSPRGGRRCKQCNTDRANNLHASLNAEQKAQRTVVARNRRYKSGGSPRWSADHCRKLSESQRGRDTSVAVARSAEVRAARKVCKNGHPFTPENTYEYGGVKTCRLCRTAAKRRYLRK